MNIYLASSWRNTYQADVLAALRAAHHEVYDFKNPAPGNTGFGWKQCDPELATSLSVERMRRAFSHPAAVAGFKCDYDAMKWAHACVLLLPSGMSAHLEAGWFGGRGKPVVVCAPEIREPELMYKCFDVAGDTPMFATVEEVIGYLATANLATTRSTEWARVEDGEIAFGLLADGSDEGELSAAEAREIAADLVRAADELEEQTRARA